MMKKTVILISFLVLTNHILFSQHISPIFTNISSKLPSTEVHDVFQDSIGYIWFATDRGIARYDGQNMLTVNTHDYFTSSVFKFFKDSNQKVWINTETMNSIGSTL